MLLLVAVLYSQDEDSAQYERKKEVISWLQGGYPGGAPVVSDPSSRTIYGHSPDWRALSNSSPQRSPWASEGRRFGN